MTSGAPKREALPEAGSDEGGLYGLTPALLRAVRDALDRDDETRLRELIAPLHAADLADLIERLRGEERRHLVALAGSLVGGEVLAFIEDDVREAIIRQLDTRDVAAAISDLDTDDAVAVIEDLDPPQQREILDALPDAADRHGVAESLNYPENTAGRLMQREFISLPAFWTVGQTIDFMRESDDLPHDFYEIFVVNPRQEPIGTVPLNSLLRTRRPIRLRDIMQEELHVIPADTDQEEVGFVFDQYDLISAPVVGASGRLIGVITVDDVLDVAREEAEEDIFRLSGVPEADIYRAALQTAGGRFVWLLVNLGTAILASFVIYQFEGTIEQMVALAVLMPIVASMGGNAGTQTLTVAVRAIATKDLTVGTIRRVLGKETIVGLLNGVVFAVLTGGVAAAWYEDPALGYVVGGAMIINMLVAGSFGLIIPVVLWRLRIDPATAAGVLLTTVTDVIGFLAFLGLAGMFLL
ncbi:MAG: Magnesium transporter MgtE [Alphaproteobacteria bacterium MarineAlpha10_Bin2]|nr:MAG: Magnesium transporter MgtE [Alphaproteobacteria bacterium MarineAlpha10_Bin2]